MVLDRERNEGMLEANRAKLGRDRQGGELKADAGYTMGDKTPQMEGKICFKCGEKGHTQNAKRCKKYGKTVKCAECGRNHHSSVHYLLLRYANDNREEEHGRTEPTNYKDRTGIKDKGKKKANTVKIPRGKTQRNRVKNSH